MDLIWARNIVDPNLIFSHTSLLLSNKRQKKLWIWKFQYFCDWGHYIKILISINKKYYNLKGIHFLDSIWSKNYGRVKLNISTYLFNPVKYTTKPVAQEIYAFDGVSLGCYSSKCKYHMIQKKDIKAQSFWISFRKNVSYILL